MDADTATGLQPQLGSNRQRTLGYLCMRFLSNICQCMLDPEYQETLNEEDRDLPAFPPQRLHCQGKVTLVLDLDETLIHSAGDPLPNWDFTVPFVGDSGVAQRFVKKRPGLDKFLQRVGELFEVVIFTASTESYAGAVIDKIDPDGIVQGRLYRESCISHPSGFQKDLRRLNRNLQKVIIIDVRCTQNSPLCYSLQPDNALPISTWLQDESDQSLPELLALLEVLATTENAPADLKKYRPLLTTQNTVETAGQNNADKEALRQ